MIYALGNILTRIPMAVFQSVILKKNENKKALTKELLTDRWFWIAAVMYFGLGIFVDIINEKQGLFKIVLETTIFLIISMVAIKGSLIDKLKQFSVLIIVTQCFHVIVFAIVYLVKSNMDSIYHTYVDSMLGKNLYNIVIYILFIGIKLYEERKSKQKFILISLISCVFAVAQIAFYYYLFLSDPSGLSSDIIGIANICSIAVLLVHALMLVMMEKIIENQKRQNEIEKKLIEKKYEYDYFLLAEEQKESVKNIYEEMREQLQIVQNLIQTQDSENQKEAENILENLEDKINHFGRVYYCDDAVLNTIFSLKQEKARKLGLEMEIMVDSVAKVNLEDIDLCSIVTNLLDNAIEATDKYINAARDNNELKANSEDIKVRLANKSGYLVLKVENPTSIPLKKGKKGRFISSKQETSKFAEHGRGIHIVEKLLEKAEGYLDFKEEKGRVVMTAFMKVKEE